MELKHCHTDTTIFLEYRVKYQDLNLKTFALGMGNFKRYKYVVGYHFVLFMGCYIFDILQIMVEL